MTSLFIAGATGLVGGQALELALADARVIAPTRRSIASHPKLANPRLDALMDDLGPEGWRGDGAICAPPTKCGPIDSIQTPYSESYFID
jgi:hypothetical protein